MTNGEIMKDLAERADCGEYDMWCRAYCWHYGMDYFEDAAYMEVEMDFGNYLHSLFQEEVTPVYVKSFARTFKLISLEA